MFVTAKLQLTKHRFNAMMHELEKEKNELKMTFEVLKWQ